MSEANTSELTSQQLSSEQALARRWLRQGRWPLTLWQWLGGSLTAPPELRAASPAILDALSAFAPPLAASPLGTQPGDGQRNSLTACLKTVSQAMSLAVVNTGDQARPCVERMLATSLLPMYRGLADINLSEVCAMLRRQLADCVTLSALLAEFGTDLEQLLMQALCTDKSPYETLISQLQLDLTALTERLLACAQKWDGQSATDLDQLVRQEPRLPPRPAWAGASVLWRLSGELIADRAEFVVPRDWTNVPVPWNQAAGHWRGLCVALGQLADQASSEPLAELRASSLDRPDKKSPDQLSDQLSDQSGLAANTSAMARAENSIDAPDRPLNADDEISRLKLEIEIADTIDSLVQASRRATGRAPTSRPDAAHDSPAPPPRNDDFVMPKVIIAEVRSHNDPAFVSVVRRQLGLCRNEARTMSLIAVRVIPESDQEHQPTLQALGLATWQQKLVNWLSDHPEVHDPYAFISNEGELILSLMDIERNTSTTLLRQGLIEVLMGASLSSGSAAALQRAPMPARYFSGIGSVTAPSASFGPEQLIEATYRCLEAVQRQGKAAIKSIEVF